MTGFTINQRVGVVHEDGCPSLARMRPENLSPWNPERAHLTPGVVFCPVCITTVTANLGNERDSA